MRDNGLLWEAELLPRSYGGDSWFGKFAPPAGAELVSSLPAITTALLRRKVTITGALKPHKLPSQDLTAVKRIYDIVEGRDERVELNLYITGTDEDNAENVPEPTSVGAESPAAEGTN